MIALDEDSLICDFAETYHILNYRELSPQQAGVLACGLRDNSRIKLKLSDMKISFENILLAAIADKLETQLYQYAKTHGAKNVKEPVSIVAQLNNTPKQEKDFTTYKTGEDFMKAWEE